MSLKDIEYYENLKRVEENIFNKTGLSYGEVVEYYPETQTVKVKLLPDGLVTTDIPVSSVFSGDDYGMVVPYFKGQQVLVGFLGDINNAVIIKSFYNKIDKAPTIPGELLDNGILKQKTIDPEKNVSISTKNNVLTFDDDYGMIHNSIRPITQSSTKGIHTRSPMIRKSGNVGINIPSNTSDMFVIHTMLDDLNNKFAQLAALSQANRSQFELMGKLVQYLTWAVHLIGLSPLKIINIYGLYPALANAPFLKFFKGAMTDLKAIQFFNMVDLLSNRKNIGSRLKKYGIAGVKSEINTILSMIKHGDDISKYINFLDFDMKKVAKGDKEYIAQLVIQRIPEVTPAHSKARRVVNIMSSLFHQAYFYYEMLHKNLNRITNSAFFKHKKVNLQNAIKNSLGSITKQKFTFGTFIDYLKWLTYGGVPPFMKQQSQTTGQTSNQKTGHKMLFGYADYMLPKRDITIISPENDPEGYEEYMKIDDYSGSLGDFGTENLNGDSAIG